MDATLTGYSRAMYANWLWHRPLQLLIDAGEGLTLALGSQVFSPAVVALTHGHSDHVLGLPGLAGARRFGKGARGKAWTVLYPEGSPGVAATRELMARLWQEVAFPVTWRPIAAGDTYEMDKHHTLEAFAVTHVASEITVGYRVLEHRRRLRPEHAATPAADIEHLAREHGRDALMEAYQHIVFAHSGDAMPIDADLVRHADLLVHDATFLSSDDRREPIHATSEEALEVAHAASVRTLVLHHLSVRYARDAAYRALREQVAASPFTGACWLLDEDVFVNLREAAPTANLAHPV
ncbi:MAG: MBL fold metallo-hydrolase [Acidobacteriota bacterium]